MRSVDNTQDVLDSRDIIARIEELEEEKQALIDAVTEAQEAIDDYEGDLKGEEFDELHDKLEDASEEMNTWDTTEEGKELKILKALEEEASGSPDWRHGETLIRDSYFQSYAEELAEDCGMLKDATAWPLTCIDWEHAARELQYDYTAVDFDGITYWIRS